MFPGGKYKEIRVKLIFSADTNAAMYSKPSIEGVSLLNILKVMVSCNSMAIPPYPSTPST